MSRPKPPGWAEALAETLVRGRDREFVLGDLGEMYARRAGERGTLVATAAYAGWAVRSALQTLRTEAFTGVGGDVRHAWRQLRKTPRVHLTGALVLAVGLGGATFSWGVHYGRTLRPLPVAHADRLFEIALFERGRGSALDGLSIQDAALVSDAVPGIESIGLWGNGQVRLNDDVAPPDRLSAVRVSPDMFELLGLRPALGRLFHVSETEQGSPGVVVLSHDLWTGRYGADPEILGRTVRIDGEPTVVIGVLRPGDRFLGADPLWLPIGPHDDPAVRTWVAMARADPGVSRTELTPRLRAVSVRLPRDPGQEGELELGAVRVGYSLRGPNTDVGTRVMSGAGILLFAMALANVANLFLVRARTRARELAVRRAVGAGPLQALRQLAVEAALPALLGLAGGALIAGSGLAWYGSASLVYTGGVPAPISVHYGLEAPHFAVLAAGAFSSTVFVSLVGGAWELRRDGYAALRATGAGRSTFGAGKALLAIEVAVGGTLLLLASLLLRSAWNLRSVDYGFAIDNVVTGSVELGASRATDAQLRAFFRALEERLAARPGVESATLATQLPMIRYRGSRRVEIEGMQAERPGDVPEHYSDFVTPGFFSTFGRPVVEGRAFTHADDETSEPVAILNEPFARRYFGREVPIGRRIRIWSGPEPGPWRSVVGIAPHLWMDTDVNRSPEGVYVPMAQAPQTWAQIALRVRGDPAAYAPVLREVVAGLVPDLPVLDVQTMSDLIRMRTRFYRFQSPPFIAVGVAALVLAMVGLFGVVSYLASLRRAEFGIRAVVGAGRPELVWRSVGSVLVPTSVGAAIGLGAGLFLVRGFERWLFLLEPWDPWVMAATLSGLGIATLLSALGPALRASRVDPVRVLQVD